MTVFRTVQGVCQKAGFADVRRHAHTFRRSYDIHMLWQGVPITIFREPLERSGISSTLVYLWIAQPDKRTILDQERWL